ncbi:carboxypeptidase regulatory-like domain-containing protein, partial [Geobacter sp. OR-1]|uniref:carboxypeptidase regulatory-like domain-containing protein n=1 Tax=Geobacter sp. OR-1 TaxID=1266765 RepID=UPI0005A75C8F
MNFNKLVKNNKLSYLLVAITFLLSFTSFSVYADQGSPSFSDNLKSLHANTKLSAPDDVLSDFVGGKPVTPVIVALQPSTLAKSLAAKSKIHAQPPGAFTVSGATSYYNLQDESIKSQLIATVTETVERVINQLGVTGITVVRKYPYEFGFAAKVTPEALTRILDLPDVLSVEKDDIESGKYFSSSPQKLSDGSDVEMSVISGPPVPPPGFAVERQEVSLPVSDSAGVKILTVPAFNWVMGCSAVSGAMIAGYYDRSGFSNMYAGPTNGGVMPLDNSSWPTWWDGYSTYPNCPLIASKNGVDGRTARGSIDDYWVKYGSSVTDPFITNGWTEHTPGTAIADYMKTSQSRYGNSDGSTAFWNWVNSSNKLTCTDMVNNSFSDGTLGRKRFYEARGYTVTDCYNQKTDNTIAGGFSFAKFKAEIDAGRPVFLNLAGHSVVGVGYDESSNLVYLHDTWDYSNHTMTWGTSYNGMGLLSVSMVNLAPVANPLSVLSGTVLSGSATGPVLPSATVSIAGKTAITSATGTFSITGIPEGTYPLTITKAGHDTYSNPSYDMTSDKTGQLFYLTYSLSGTVRSGSATGPVLAGATVSIAGKTTTT